MGSSLTSTQLNLSEIPTTYKCDDSTNELCLSRFHGETIQDRTLRRTGEIATLGEDSGLSFSSNKSHDLTASQSSPFKLELQLSCSSIAQRRQRSRSSKSLESPKSISSSPSFSSLCSLSLKENHQNLCDNNNSKEKNSRGVLQEQLSTFQHSRSQLDSFVIPASSASNTNPSSLKIKSRSISAPVDSRVEEIPSDVKVMPGFPKSHSHSFFFVELPISRTTVVAKSEHVSFKLKRYANVK
jgi:hypothetical protein